MSGEHGVLNDAFLWAWKTRRFAQTTGPLPFPLYLYLMPCAAFSACTLATYSHHPSACLLPHATFPACLPHLPTLYLPSPALPLLPSLPSSVHHNLP